jgi:ribose transport system substrate-binding protein
MPSSGKKSAEQPRRQYLKHFAGTALLGTGLAGCMGGGGGGSGDDSSDSGGSGSGGDTTESGGTTSEDTTSGSDEPLQFGMDTHTTSGAWATAMMEATEFYAADQGIEFEIFTNGGSQANQISNINQMVNQGYDGILIVTYDTQGAAGAIEDAVDAGVPVFTMDSDAATEAVNMHVSWDGTQAAAHSAELLTEQMRSQNPDQDEFEVLEIRAPPGRDIARRRHEPFVETIENTDGVSIAGTVNGEWGRAASQEKALQWINSNEAPDGLYAASYLMGLGGQDALAELDLQYPMSHDQHVAQIQLDGSPESHELILDGYIDTAVDQPVHFYGPLALRYMERVAREGESAIPEAGTEITADDISIPSAQHKGVELWSDPIWEPGAIDTAFEHPWLVTNYVDITQENANSENLWGNIWGQQ